MVTVVSQGDQVIGALGTEYSLVTYAVNGIYVLVVYPFSMAGSDQVELYLYDKVRDSGTGNTKQLRKKVTSSAGAQTLILEAGPIETSRYVEAAVKQLAGTLRTFPWELRRLA